MPCMELLITTEDT